MRYLYILLICISFNLYGEDRMLHPDFPVIDGRYQMTDGWSIALDQPYNRRFEESELVIWRPGFTFWIRIWGNDNQDTVKERLAWIKEEASSAAFECSEISNDHATFYMYRLTEDHDGKTVQSLNAYVLSSEGHVQISAYFDDENDFGKAKEVIRSVEVDAP